MFAVFAGRLSRRAAKGQGGQSRAGQGGAWYVGRGDKSMYVERKLVG